jgi:hypothetical protein
MTILPKFTSYRKFKPDWKYEKEKCGQCSKEYMKDNMLCTQERKNLYLWYCIRCYNFLPKS